MNCKVEYIEQAYRTVHSEFADALTNAHHSIFNRVKQWNNENPKASFTRKESDDSKVRFTFATNGSAAQKKQAKFVQQLNRENPSNNDVPVIHSVGGELRVNVLRGTNSYWKKMFEGKQFQKLTEEEKNQTIAEAAKKAGSVNALHDLAARLADRIGGEVKFENRRDVDYKGYSQGNKAVINEAYADTSTIVHEILGHPIINAIRNVNDETEQFFSGKVENVQTLYKNLLKELESGKGKEVLERVKRDYVYKENKNYEITQQDGKWWVARNEGYDGFDLIGEYNSEKEAKESLPKYTLEEQQEEAIVELLGMYTANKLDAVKDKGLIALLKQLLKEMTTYLRSLFNSKEIEIEKLDASMTLDDLANLLAYTNSKLLLPNSTIKYTTPDNQSFKTYVEASKHISELAKSAENIDLEFINLNTVKTIEEVPVSFNSSIILNSKERLLLDEDGSPDIITDYLFQPLIVKKIENNWYVSEEYDFDYAMYLYDTDPNVKETLKHGLLIPEEKVIELFNTRFKNSEFGRFIAKNTEFEKSKEIIEEWKKVNNIVYNPEEVYSRGQGFYSVVGAYSNFEVELMFQNLLQHIEDNEKAGGEFTISAFTKPIDKTISHLEGGGGKIKFVIYPKSEDIKWATNQDAYSGSVWDAAEKVNKDKKSELLGVSYTKYPSLKNLYSVQPNLANIIQGLSDHHNELGISLNSNFRIEFDENIPYSTKKILNGINSILDGKYGKLEKPSTSNKTTSISESEFKIAQNKGTLKIREDGYEYIEYNGYEYYVPEPPDFTYEKSKIGDYNYTTFVKPKITNSTLKESIDSVENNLKKEVINYYVNSNDAQWLSTSFKNKKEAEEYIKTEQLKGLPKDATIIEKKELEHENKEYTSQALINTKIAALKEVAKKYPRSLIRSEVVSINDNSNIQYQKQSPSLTTEQTTRIEELKQSDVRRDVSSNFVRNVDELGEQFEESLTSISTPTKVLKELENKLINGFLKDFNIDVTEYENFKQEIGFDAYSASDLVTKAIAYQKGESILPEVAYFAYSIMGKQNNKIKSQLNYLISKWDKYSERFEHHKQTVNKNYGFIKDVKEWRQKVSDLVILDFLKENIENHYFNPQAFTKVLDSKWTSEDFTIWQKFMDWIENLLSSFSSSYKKKQQILNNIGISIADEVLNQNYTYFNYPLKKEQVQKYYKETIETDDYAKELVEFGQSIGLVLTGSLALRKAGSVYRTLDETIHDVDFVVPFEKLLNQPQLFEKVVKNRLFEKEAFEKEFMENVFPNLSWLKEFKTKYPEYRVLAAFIGSEHAQNKESMSVGGVIGGEFYTEDGTHVEDISYYTKNEETKAPVKVTTQKTVLHKKGDWIKDTGYVVDFFVRLYPKQEQHENYFKLWKEIMMAKLKMGREKDLIDWKAFIPFTKSLNSFNFNYEGFRHINFDSSQKYQVNATNIKSTIVSEPFEEEKGESNTECFL